MSFNENLIVEENCQQAVGSKFNLVNGDWWIVVNFGLQILVILEKKVCSIT